MFRIEDVDQMLAWRPAARRLMLPGGHTLHDERADAFNDAVARFLQDVDKARPRA